MGKKIKFILSDLTDTVHSELHSKRFFKSVVIRMCRFPKTLFNKKHLSGISYNGQKINAVSVGMCRGKLRLIFMLGECVSIECKPVLNVKK